MKIRQWFEKDRGIGDMKRVQEKTSISIEDMARVFNALNISLKKLLELYTASNKKWEPLYFDKKEIEKYLSKKEIEDYCRLTEEQNEKGDFMLIGQVEEYEKEARLRQIIRSFDQAVKKELTMDSVHKEINTDLRSIILHVEMRPLMYLRKRSIYELDSFLRNIVYGGYALGKTYADTLDENSCWSYFSEWLGKKYESSRGMGWCQILMEQEKDEEKAFNRFFDEFRDYLEEIEHYRSKNEVIQCLVEQAMLEEAFKDRKLEAELENYPNKYAKEYYERSCYQIKVYKVQCDEQYGKSRRYLQTFYIERNLERIWVRYKDTILYQTLEEFIKDNENWYNVIPEEH